MASAVAHATLAVTFVRNRPEGASTVVRHPFPWLRTLGLHTLLEFKR
jgi:hypothetical protein